MFKKTLTSLFTLIVFCIWSTISLAQVPAPGQFPTGLIPMTPEKELQFKKDHLQIKNVRINKFGLERINKDRLNKKLPAFNTNLSAPDGMDIQAGSVSDFSQATAPSETDTTILAAIPSSVDNSTLPWFPPIRSQGSIGSCVAWAITYYQMTYMNAMAKGITVNTGDNTQIFSPKWTYNMINFGYDSGSYLDDAFNLIAKHGAAKWSEFPYDSNYLAWDLNSNDWLNAISNRTNSVQWITNASSSTSIQQMKQLLTNGYILTFATYINSWQYTTFKNDPATVEDDPLVGKTVAYWMNGTNGGHAMTIVGYNDSVWVDINGNNVVDSGEKGAFKIANSWGSGWGLGGFVWIAYDMLSSTSQVTGGPSSGRVGAFQSNMAFQFTVNPSYSPKMIAEFTINHLKRNQLAMSLGVSSNTTTSPSATIFPPAMYYKTGPLAFNGTTTAINGTFYYDFTDLLSGATSPQRFYVGMSDSVTGDPATLISWKLLDLTTGTTTSSVNVPKNADANTAYSYIDYAYFNGNYPPNALAVASPVLGNAPLTVTFDGSQSSDSDGSISSYIWSMGDGSSKNGTIVNYTYQNPGTYNANLTVTDNGGATASNTVSITVLADPNQLIAPSNLSLKTNGRTVTLTWNDNSSNEEGFYIEQGLKLKNVINYSRVSQVGANTKTTSVTVPASGSYSFRVQAYNLTTGKVSAYSNAVGVKIR